MYTVLKVLKMIFNHSVCTMDARVTIFFRQLKMEKKVIFISSLIEGFWSVQLTSFYLILSYKDGFYKPTIHEVHPELPMARLKHK